MTLLAANDTSVVARLWMEPAPARRLADLLAEHLPPDTAVSAYEGSDGRWCVEVHFEHPPDETGLRALVAELAGPAAGAALGFETIAARDWVAASLAGLSPVPAGRFLVHGAHDRAGVPANRIGIEIEAALAFGTGHHGTTRGCLLAIDGWLKRQARAAPARAPHSLRILDVGTGTGVLAIAAARALHRRVLASDVDRGAIAVAKDNARLNGVPALIEFVCAGGLAAGRFGAGGKFDLVCANILLGPLRLMARDMAALLAPGACVVLSGLLVAHANAALSAYRAQGLVLVRRIVLDGWVTLVLRAPEACNANNVTGA